MAEKSVSQPQIWLPSDSFELDINKATFVDTIKDFEVLEILHDPRSRDIHIGSMTQPSLQIITEADVDARLAQLKDQPDITSAFSKSELITPEYAREEARARELHLQLGRNALMLAIDSPNNVQFTKALNDYLRVIDMVDHPIYTRNEFLDGGQRSRDLGYLVIQAAQKFKTVDMARAAELTLVMDRNILPIDDKPWIRTQGALFMEKIASRNPVPVTTHIVAKAKPTVLTGKKAAPNRKTKVPAGLNAQKKPSKLLFPEVVMEQRFKVERQNGSRFLNKLNKTTGTMPYAKALDQLKEKYDLTKLEEIAPYASQTERLELACQGISGYLDFCETRQFGPAHQAATYLRKHIASDVLKATRKVLIIGNLLTDKLNQKRKADERLPLPGFEPTGIVDAFKAIRATFEKDDTKDYGDVMEAFLTVNFSKDNWNPAFREELAPQGMLSVKDFIKKELRTFESRGDIMRIAYRHNLYPSFYEFPGGLVQEGLTAEQCSIIKNSIHRIATPSYDPIPAGYVALTDFSRELGIKPENTETIMKYYELEPERHLVGKSPRKTLSPEMQKQLQPLIEEAVKRARAARPSVQKKLDALMSDVDSSAKKPKQ